MALLDSLLTALAGAGQGTVGTDLFAARMPNDPDVCTVLYESQGMGIDHTMGSDPASIERPTIRVLARASVRDYPTARARVVAARDTLGAIASSGSIIRVLATSDIYPIEFDQTERPVLACDLTVWTT